MGLLKASDDPQKDQLAFLHAQVIFWLLGATDGHAKNFSIRLGFGGGFTMTPLYDVLSAQNAFDEHQIKHSQYKLAMSLGKSRNYHLDQIVARHIFETGKLGGIGETPIRGMLENVLTMVPQALEATKNEMSEGFPNELVGAITDGVSKRAGVLERSVVSPSADVTTHHGKT